MGKSSPVTRGNFRRLFAAPHFWVVIALTILYMEYTFEPIRLYLQENNAKIGLPDLMVFYMNDATVSSFMMLCCLGLLFNVPSADEMQRYLLLRCGRKAWGKGQIRYCLWVCFAYMALTTLIVLAWAFPWIEWTMQWSDGILAFVNDFAYEIYDSFLNFDVWIPRAYTPLLGFIVEFVLHIEACFLLSMVIADVNTMIDRRFGFIAAAAPIMFDLLQEEYFSESVIYFSPLTLCRLSGLEYGDHMGRPAVLTAFLILLALGMLFAFLLKWYVSRREIRL